MANLVHNTPLEVTSGIKNIDMRMSSGDARLQMSVDGSTFVDIADTVKTASTNFNITVPACEIQAVITGDAVVKVNHIRT